jgi:indole-3-glycerol phosphate synthase
MILDQIVETKRREVARRKAEKPLAGLERTIAGMAPARDFARAVGTGPCAIIAEVKRRSPSRGLLRADLDPAAIARLYERHGAAAISVLTDEAYFGGSEQDLRAVKAAVELPVLRKEFIIDAYQICEARAMGADAILLIAAVLGDDRLRSFREMAESLGMAALVEVHDEKELELALAAGARIVGINNRDLKTFATDIGTSEVLAPRIPRDRTVVAESGIRTRGQIETLLAAGVRAFLIGETLISAPDIGAKLEELLGR